MRAIKCDRCGVYAAARNLGPNDIPLMPKSSWENVSGRDLCPECHSRFLEFMKELKPKGET